MIEELFYLIKLLFTRIPNSLEIVRLNHFPFKGYVAMMWCGRLITKQDYIPAIVENHELIHLKQAQVKGSWIKYYLSYLYQYLKRLPGSKKAYYTNPYEVEAYANEQNFKYTQDYNKEEIRKYRNIAYISDIKEWIRYIKTL